jgi:hypothetical protein
MSLNKLPTRQSNTDPEPDSKLLAELVDRAMQRAVQAAIEEHHRLGNPVPIWREGEIVLLYPDGSVQRLEH